MKIYFIMNVRFPTEKAHGWQIAKMCEAFTRIGHEVVLVVPKRRNIIKATPEQYYSLKTPIRTVYIHVIDLLPLKWVPKKLAFILMEYSFIFGVKKWATGESSGRAYVFTRDHFLVKKVLKASWKQIFEMHDVPEHFFTRHRDLVKTVDLFVTTNQWKMKEAIRVWGEVVRDRMLALPNAIDIQPYLELPDSQDAKKILGWDSSKRYVVYTGHFYAWKGVHVLVEASKFLSDQFRIVLVGGTEEHFADMKMLVDKERLTRVVLVPHVSQDAVKQYLAAADCLVLPNSGKSWNSKYTTSPIKLWEYLAARRPVVASDLPAIRELVSDEQVFFVEADHPRKLADAMRLACEGDRDRIEAGFQLAKGNDWGNRTRKLADAMMRL